MADVGILFGLLAMLGWGVSDFLIKLAVDRVGAYRASIWVYTVGGCVAIAAFALFPAVSSFSLMIAALFLVEAVLNFVAYLSLYKGMERGRVSVVSPIVSAYPVITVILSMVILSEAVRAQQAVATMLIVAGLMLLTYRPQNSDRRDVGFALMSMVIYGISVFVFGYLIRATSWIFALALSRVLCWTIMFSFMRIKQVQLRLSSPVLLLVIITGIIEIGGTIVYSIGLSISPISLISVISSTYPLIAILLAWIFMHEQINRIQMAGILGVIAGLALISL